MPLRVTHRIVFLSIALVLFFATPSQVRADDPPPGVAVGSGNPAMAVLEQSPGPGPGPSCDLPPLICTEGKSRCGELVRFEPTFGRGYIDYPLNGETWRDQYRSWIRRDVAMMIQYGAAMVDCKAAGWTIGNHRPLGLADMSERDGAIPGESTGNPGHPPRTHVDGFDIDVSYYQIDTPDNRTRAVCEHHDEGRETYHCTAPPDKLDVYRTALFLGALFEHPNLRIVGCDGMLGKMLEGAIDELCETGWIHPRGCANRKLAYEQTDRGRGWYLFHHHHLHISFSQPDYKEEPGA